MNDFVLYENGVYFVESKRQCGGREMLTINNQWLNGTLEYSILLVFRDETKPFTFDVYKQMIKELS